MQPKKQRTIDFTFDHGSHFHQPADEQRDHAESEYDGDRSSTFLGIDDAKSASAVAPILRAQIPPIRRSFIHFGKFGRFRILRDVRAVEFVHASAIDVAVGADRLDAVVGFHVGLTPFLFVKKVFRAILASIAAPAFFRIRHAIATARRILTDYQTSVEDRRPQEHDQSRLEPEFREFHFPRAILISTTKIRFAWYVIRKSGNRLPDCPLERRSASLSAEHICTLCCL